MSSQRYERIAADDEDDHSVAQPAAQIPNSPPPSFRSHVSSRQQSSDNARQTAEERDLDDAFDAPSDDEDEDRYDSDQHDRRRLINNDGSRSPDSADAAEPASDALQPGTLQRQVTEIPSFTSNTVNGRAVASSQANDGVWANISAKPRPGEELEEKPPTYEQAAADATPPYWETTILSPYGTTGNPDDVFVDGLLVGSIFSFIWNGLISMSFQLIGFLLTYLLHTTHAAKHGSRAGLGITLIQYGFQMRYASSVGSDPNIPNAPVDGVPDDPNSHDFDPTQVGNGDPNAGPSLSAGDWLSYVLMIIGWFILIRAVSDFMRARRQEALVRSSPDRGLGVAVIAEAESPETSV